MYRVDSLKQTIQKSVPEQVVSRNASKNDALLCHDMVSFRLAANAYPVSHAHVMSCHRTQYHNVMKDIARCRTASYNMISWGIICYLRQRMRCIFPHMFVCTTYLATYLETYVYLDNPCNIPFSVRHTVWHTLAAYPAAYPAAYLTNPLRRGGEIRQGE